MSKTPFDEITDQSKLPEDMQKVVVTQLGEILIKAEKMHKQLFNSRHILGIVLGDIQNIIMRVTQ